MRVALTNEQIPEGPGGLRHLPEIQRRIHDEQCDAADEPAQATFLARPPRQMANQTVGDLFLEMHNVPKVIPTGYRGELAVKTAELRTEFEASDVRYTRRYVASPTHQVIAMRLKHLGERPERPGKRRRGRSRKDRGKGKS